MNAPNPLLRLSNKDGRVLPNRIAWSACSDKGRIRPSNEDAFVGVRFDAREVQRLGRHGEEGLETMDYAFAVGDGMGGEKAGEFASRIAAEKITALMPRAFALAAKGIEAGHADVLGELFARIHDAITYLGRSYAECARMQTTLSLGWFSPGWLYFAHVGDSRIYHRPARDGAARQLTHDDTYVGWLLRQGQINEREARSHPRRNVLQKALGAGNQFAEPQIGAVAVEPGDTFLFCSDGLVDGLWDHAIADHLCERPSPATAHALVNAALDGGSRDNVTAVVVRLE